MTEREKILILIDKIASSNNAYANEDLETIEEGVEKMAEYVRKVISEGIGLPVAKYTQDRDKYLEYVEKYDDQRHTAHEGAILSVTLINRLAENHGLDPIFTQEQTKDRIAIADTCLAVTEQFFRTRKL